MLLKQNYPINLFLMKKLLSTNYSELAFNVGILLTRIVFGFYMMMSGYDKLAHFAEKKAAFMNFLSLGSTTSLILVVFAEFFCALFVMIGLFTRLSAITIVICMSVALFKAHGGDILNTGSHATMFLTVFMMILMVGPGKFSVDGFSGK